MGPVLFIVCAVLAEPVVLDNGVMRVEVDPALFNVCSVGLSGKPGFVERLDVSEQERSGGEWVDAGGLVTDLVPYDGRDAAIRRGPGTITERTESRVVMVGPPSGRTGVYLVKELTLDGKEPTARFKVSAVAGEAFKGEMSLALRNTVRIPAKSTLRVTRADGSIRVLAGAKTIQPAVVKSMRFWLIPVPPTSTMKEVVLGAFVPAVEHERRDGVWTRRLVGMPSSDKGVPANSTFLCLLDDDSRSYGAALQGATAVLRQGGRIEFEEEWALEKRGR